MSRISSIQGLVFEGARSSLQSRQVDFEATSGRILRNYHIPTNLDVLLRWHRASVVGRGGATTTATATTPTSTSTSSTTPTTSTSTPTTTTTATATATATAILLYYTAILLYCYRYCYCYTTTAAAVIIRSAATVSPTSLRYNPEFDCYGP